MWFGKATVMGRSGWAGNSTSIEKPAGSLESSSLRARSESEVNRLDRVHRSTQIPGPFRWLAWVGLATVGRLSAGRFLAGLLSVGLLASCSSAPEQKLNLLVLSADSLRADRLALWNEPSSDGVGVETPALAALAARGTLFRNVWAVAPWTAPSMVSVFTGLYPPSHGAVARDDTTPLSIDTLPRLADHNAYCVGNFSFFSGISYFRNLGLPPAVPGLQHGREPEVLANWLDGEVGQSPFFAWIHLLEPHLPYGATGYRAKDVQIAGSSGLEASQLQATVPVGSVEFEDGDRQRLLDLYDSDIEKLDQRIAEITQVLESRDLLDNTIVVFIADHGEELLEHGWVGHASTSIEAKVTREILRIPLLILGPGVEAGVESDDLAQHVDLLPTVNRLLGWHELERTDGRDLLRPRGWLSGLFGARHRQFAFVDSSVGGNLTPVERRQERLQAVTDGRCLVEASSRPGEPDGFKLVAFDSADCDQRKLQAALRDWREEQLQQRLAILQQDSESGGPSLDEVDDYELSIDGLAPVDGSILGWREQSGQLELEWSGEERAYWVQYEVGRGVLAVRGVFQVEQRRIAFGPFPEGFWNDLAGYSPFRYRVLDPEMEARSDWVEFSLESTR